MHLHVNFLKKDTWRNKNKVRKKPIQQGDEMEIIRNELEIISVQLKLLTKDDTNNIKDTLCILIQHERTLQYRKRD